MATIQVPEQQATITAALAAASDGDTISVADGTYSENFSTGALSNVTITSRGTDPTAVTITSATAHASGGVVCLGTGCMLVGVTVRYTGSTTNIYAVRSTTGYVDFTVYNCHLYTEVSGIYGTGLNAVVDRCRIECTHKGTTNTTWGIYSAYGTIGSTLVLDFNWTGIWAPWGAVVNTTMHTNHIKNTSLRGIYCRYHYNNIAVKDSATNAYAGINTYSSGGSSTNCISYGWVGSAQGDYSYASSSNTNNITSATVTQPVFLDEAADNFHPDLSGSAYQSGVYTFQSTYNVFKEDLDNVSFNDPPSRGCYEYVAPGGGGGAAHVRCRLKLGLGL